MQTSVRWKKIKFKTTPLFKASKLNRTAEMLKSELSTSQDRNKKQADELNQFQEQIVVSNVE